MSFEQKPNSGSLFKNDRKEKETQPDYKGDCLIDGKLYWMSAWLNTSPKGTKYMSLKFNEKEAREERPQTLAEQAAANGTPPSDDFGDSQIPF